MRIVIPITRFIQYHIDFGYETPLWSSMYWFTVIKVWYNESHEVEFAATKFCFFKHYKFWL